MAWPSATGRWHGLLQFLDLLWDPDKPYPDYHPQHICDRYGKPATRRAKDWT